MAACGPLPAEVIPVPEDRRKGWTSVIWSFLFLTTGVVLLIFLPGAIFVSIPLFLACFVVSIFAIANRRFVSGVLMLILLFTVPAICVVARILNDGGKDIEKGVLKLEEKRDTPK